MIIADFHIHSKYSRACSKDLDLVNLEKWAKIKGIDVLGTGDFTHPLWLKELKSNLKDEEGIYTYKNIKFILQSEISLIYKKNNKVRRVHYVILAPNFDIVDQINEYLRTKGRLDYDGRPMFGLDSIELVENLMEISKDIEIMPAHAWTPWYSIFGSNSGFDSVEECFEDKTKYIHALETGMSSDPEMNCRISSLDKFTLVSNSDSHSFWPWRLGREANVFDFKKVNYENLIKAIRTREGFVETIEVNPNYGKYHFDGHRNCKISFSPDESKKHNNICPVCKTKLTIGVLHRVEELADRPLGFKLKDAVPFKRIIPLSEIIAGYLNVNQMHSRSVFNIYNTLISEFNNEFNILLNLKRDDMIKYSDPKLVDLIIKNRKGEVEVKPGYDGVYGEPILKVSKQSSLTRFG